MFLKNFIKGTEFNQSYKNKHYKKEVEIIQTKIQ